MHDWLRHAVAIVDLGGAIAKRGMMFVLQLHGNARVRSAEREP